MVMVLSESFIKSDWCMFEFHTAHARVISEHKNFIIIIMLDDITGLELDKTLQSYMRTHVCNNCLCNNYSLCNTTACVIRN